VFGESDCVGELRCIGGIGHERGHTPVGSRLRGDGPQLGLGSERIRKPRIVSAAVDGDDVPSGSRERSDGGGADAAGQRR
jgi:hypothetical protein